MNISLPSDKLSVDEAIDWLNRNAPDETSTMGEAIYTVLAETNRLNKESADKERAYNEEYNLRKDMQRELKQVLKDFHLLVEGKVSRCNVCKYYNMWGKYPCINCCIYAADEIDDNWEWRGMK